MFVLLLIGLLLMGWAALGGWRSLRKERLAELLRTTPRAEAEKFVPAGPVSGRKLRQIIMALPLWTELLALALEAGLGLPEAISRVAAGMPGPLSDAMLQVLREQSAGKSPQVAWQDFVRRYPHPDIRAVALILAQATRYGNPVASLLRYQMEQLRTREQTRLQEQVRLAVIRMKLPMVLFMLFPFLAIILAPALMSLSQALDG